ncbi:uncharacterized protein F5147DRAFT_653093 [Suillus discolor]|uniref:Uncharacterized protein n=1 Tax=Suillus discolor TaxID=1912936 RepID=A0A9P7JTX9_9AGAM|nr:uncharacterized protein F5147DRAFT_653093 [Suillus discolor]KAG2108003.1 hypothetical protein F5147DRAFT_653093 [Suillus discolor]
MLEPTPMAGDSRTIRSSDVLVGRRGATTVASKYWQATYHAFHWSNSEVFVSWDESVDRACSKAERLVVVKFKKNNISGSFGIIFGTDGTAPRDCNGVMILPTSKKQPHI